ncbi:hypothetical protein [Paraburkholderia atlantica]|uniref:hypothetical protein n=1 Tax=Paraburkholderia atlantica TaxID=2654982 RepID=UPI0012FE9D8A|nr:hypothetical protein [Paraburkholderia atlantica]
MQLITWHAKAARTWLPMLLLSFEDDGGLPDCSALLGGAVFAGRVKKHRGAKLFFRGAARVIASPCGTVAFTSYKSRTTAHCPKHENDMRLLG